MGLWYDEVWRDRVRLGLRSEQTLFSERSPYQKVELVDTVAYGRVLIIDEVFMTSERDEFIYHEMLTHPAMVTSKSIERVLIIGGGDGGTAREVLRYPGVREVVMVELDEVVVRACQAHLTSIGTAWTDPRLDVRIGDGIHYVKHTSDEPYDVVLLDGTDPVGPGKVLFDIDFLRGVSRVLASDGVLCMQSESPLFFPSEFGAVLRDLGTLFAKVHPYFGSVPLYQSGTWSWTYATRSRDHLAIQDERITQVERSCRYYNREIHAAAFVQPTYIRKIIAEGASGSRQPAPGRAPAQLTK